jgi:hypothetical protein
MPAWSADDPRRSARNAWGARHRRSAGRRRARTRRVILADTSAWVDYNRASDNAIDRRLTALIASDGPIAVTEPVVVEVLAGARTGAQP